MRVDPVHAALDLEARALHGERSPETGEDAWRRRFGAACDTRHAVRCRRLRWLWRGDGVPDAFGPQGAHQLFDFGRGDVRRQTVTTLPVRLDLIDGRAAA